MHDPKVGQTKQGAEDGVLLTEQDWFQVRMRGMRMGYFIGFGVFLGREFLGPFLLFYSIYGHLFAIL